jgi:hypothetical protein
MAIVATCLAGHRILALPAAARLRTMEEKLGGRVECAKTVLDVPADFSFGVRRYRCTPM